MLEPLNSIVDHPGYFLDSPGTGFEIINLINRPGLKLLYDVYHMQMMKVNHIETIEENLPAIGHFHLASAPGKREIYLGDLNFKTIFQAINESNYKGTFGLEYWPSELDETSLVKSFKYIKDLNQN